MIYRSLYFLFHGERSVRDAIDELEKSLGLEDFQLHAITNEGHTLVELQGATVHHKSTADLRKERLFWYLSIGTFTTALIALVIALLAASWFWAILLGFLVVGSQLSGYLFGHRIPNAQLDRFRTGLEQGDIVLQVDAPRDRVREIRAFLAEHHPDSTTNISNWHVGALGM